MTDRKLERAINRVFRAEHGAVIARLVAALGNLDLAEEALQDAFMQALQRWPVSGIPERPGAWLTTVARNRGLDRIRRERVFANKATAIKTTAEALGEDRLGTDETDDALDRAAMEHALPDERLRLIFTCCHPALSNEARVALTLRMLGGLTTPEIARAFLVQESTMAQRIVRAKKKIHGANIPFRIPPADVLPERIDSVLAVVYLIFNEGYAVTDGENLTRGDLCEEAIRLGAILTRLLPETPEVRGLYSLMLLHDARRDARVDAQGDLIILEHQDRARWDSEKTAAGITALTAAVQMNVLGPYQVQAAISAEHAVAPSWEQTRWDRVLELYDRLVEFVPSPMVALNRCVPLAMTGHNDAALERLAELELDLGTHYKHAVVRAWLLANAGQIQAARAAYEKAIEGCSNAAERRHLERESRRRCSN
ncbi:MAG: sigma-70 family RNA polymerase sigma factor [Nannocystaceae bacterium]|nr:sigma-70 family RNA polymerase sigma factor [Nannocystaceae bacterium]